MSNKKLHREPAKKKGNLVFPNINDQKFEQFIRIFFWIVTAVYLGLCIFLYYNQSIQPAVKGVNNGGLRFESDLPFHISMVVDDGWYYSLTAIIYLALYNMAGKTTVLIAIFLGLVSAGTVLLTEKLLRVLGIRNAAVTCGGAFILNMVMPFYIKWAGMYRYISYQSGNIWHNSTYQCMRLAALVSILLFLKYDKKALGMNKASGKTGKADKADSPGISVKEWIFFSLSLAVCTAIKPSFLTVFAPAFAVKLLYNWLKDKVQFKRILIWGLTVIPACGVMLWQNSVLFGSDTDNGFKISFMEAFSVNANHPKITVLLSLAFPIVIFICYVIDLLRYGKINLLLKDRKYLFSILMALVGFAEAILLVETGSRSRDGNFLWGYSIALVWLYTLSFVKWNELLNRKRWFLFVISTLVLGYQYFCGVKFFSMLLKGISYFMYY